VPSAPSSIVLLLAKGRTGDLQAGDGGDVDAVGATGSAFAVALERAALDRDGAARDCCRENPVLVVKEARLAHGQIPAFRTDAGAVLIGHARARKGDVLDRDVGAADHPDRLAGAGAVAHVRRTGRGFEDQMVGAPDRAVDILAGVDADDVAVPGHRSGIARRVQAALRADQEHLGADPGRAGGGPAESEKQRAPPVGHARCSRRRPLPPATGAPVSL
jgi:hypothetical protein